MAKLVYSMMVSLDGFVATPDGGLGWQTIDEEIHRFANDQARAAGAFLYGRRLYENMAAFWPDADADPSAPDFIAEFARIWRAKPKVVFSSTLQEVGWNGRIVRGDPAAEIARLKIGAGADLTIGGPTLAAAALEAGLVDELSPIVHPAVVGAGLPFLPPHAPALSLRLLETRRFASGAVSLRYERRHET